MASTMGCLLTEAIGDEGQSRMGLSDLLEESLSRIRFTVLFHGPIRIPYPFRIEGNHLMQPRMDQCRPEDLVGELECVTSPLLYCPPQAGRTGDMIGGEILAAVHDAQIVFAQYLVLIEMLTPPQEAEEGGEEAFKFVGIDLVHDGSHLRV